MLRLYDFAMAITEPEQGIVLVDTVTDVVCFYGTAEQLLNYSGLNTKQIKSFKHVDSTTHGVKDMMLFIK